MIVKEHPAKLFLPRPKAPRSEGIHVSSIIRCIATESGILKPEWAEELALTDVRTITDPVALMRISVGLAWEEWYIPNILAEEGVVDHPGEMELDGVYLTHDGESIDAIVKPHIASLVVHECKVTYKSTKTVGNLITQWMWMTQMKAYCKATQTQFAHMHVLFLCGDYKMPICPQLKRWSIEFTQEEIDRSWDQLITYKNDRIARGDL